MYGIDVSAREFDPSYFKGVIENYAPADVLPFEIFQQEEWTKGSASYMTKLKRMTATPKLAVGATMQQDDFEAGKQSFTAGRWGQEYPLSKDQEGRAPASIVTSLVNVIMEDGRNAVEAEFEAQLKGAIIPAGDGKNTVAGASFADASTDPISVLESGSLLMKQNARRVPNILLGTAETLSLFKKHKEVRNFIYQMRAPTNGLERIGDIPSFYGMRFVEIPENIYLSKDDAKANNLATLADKNKIYMAHVNPVPEMGLGVLGIAPTTNGPENNEEMVNQGGGLSPKIWRGGTSGVGGGAWYYRTEFRIQPVVLNTGCVVEITGVNPTE